VKPKLVTILLLIVLLPLGLMAWLGLRVAGSERAAVEESFRQLHRDKLAEVEAGILKVVGQREREMLTLADSLTLEPGVLRAAVRNSPAVSQIFVLSDKGKLVHPDIGTRLSRDEEEFLTRAQQVWKDQAVFFRPAGEAAQPDSPRQGWYSWYWGSGVNFIFWRRDASGRILGFELDRYRLIADIIAQLPDSSPTAPGASTGALALLDSKGETLYQWGDYQPGDREQPLVVRSLGAPLNPWRLAGFTPGAGPAGAVGSGALFGLIGALIAVGLALSGLALYFYRESSRELREARKRVSFVNHVSHELKTPLTNIRMYAELLQMNGDEKDEKSTRYLDVVVSESQRLSRLIDNVLTFGRQQRGALKLRKTPGVVDEIVGKVLESFRPSLESKGVRVRFAAGAPGRVLLDPDALRQIVSNLLGNVEKYARDTGEVEVNSSRQEGKTFITVSDRGPGIPPAERENIFEPFVRLSSRVSDGVAGTGIGLSIARELARLHGGDLTLEPSERGATFRVTLATQAE
jgi:signal transduction histidine kinase